MPTSFLPSADGKMCGAALHGPAEVHQASRSWMQAPTLHTTHPTEAHHGAGAHPRSAASRKAPRDVQAVVVRLAAAPRPRRVPSVPQLRDALVRPEIDGAVRQPVQHRRAVALHWSRRERRATGPSHAVLSSITVPAWFYVRAQLQPRKAEATMRVMSGGVWWRLTACSTGAGQHVHSRHSAHNLGPFHAALSANMYTAPGFGRRALSRGP